MGLLLKRGQYESRYIVIGAGYGDEGKGYFTWLYIIKRKKKCSNTLLMQEAKQVIL